MNLTIVYIRNYEPLGKFLVAILIDTGLVSLSYFIFNLQFKIYRWYGENGGKLRLFR